MSSAAFQTIKCPGCGNSLPANAARCQFCGADTSKVQRPAPPPGKPKIKAFETPKWVWFAYYAVAVWWILGGTLDVLDGFYVFGKPEEIAEAERLLGQALGPSYVTIVAGAITALFGVGLVVRVEIIRGIVNFVAGIKLIFTLLGLVATVIGSGFFGLYSIPFIIFGVLDVLSCALLIWLIGETDVGFRDI